MPDPMTPERLGEIREMADQATAGPWGWRGHDDGGVELQTLHSGRLRIIAVQRSEPCIVELADGSQAVTIEACVRCMRAFAEPEVEHLDRCEKPENLGTVWLWDNGFISPANQWAVREQPYRSDVARVDHPDAQFIAEAREIVPELLAEVDRLREHGEKAETITAEWQSALDVTVKALQALRVCVLHEADSIAGRSLIRAEADLCAHTLRTAAGQETG